MEIIEKKKNCKSKAKGNLFENKIAKELGIWIFNDKDFFSRHITSGARKNVYVGDIVPQKNVPLTFNNGVFPFLIECKNGYKNSIPNLNNQTIVRQWLFKSLTEITEKQKIIYLIVSFHGYSPLLFTDIEFNLKSNLILNLNIEQNKIVPFYIYDFKTITNCNFLELYEKNENLIKKLME